MRGFGRFRETEERLLTSIVSHVSVPLTVRRLVGHPEETALAPDVVALIHEAGNPYFDWFFGGPDPARAALERMLQRASSEVAASNVIVLLEGEKVAGVNVMLDGAELARSRKADTLALLSDVRSPESRSALLARMRKVRDLFAPVSAEEFYLSKIAVASDLRRKGYGRTLLEEYVAAGRAAGFSRFRLDVSADNQAAIALYRSAGFGIESDRKRGPLRYVAMALGQLSAASSRCAAYLLFLLTESPLASTDLALASAF
jgi:GNAT superfamily N-acetyltransferase